MHHNAQEIIAATRDDILRAQITLQELIRLRDSEEIEFSPELEDALHNICSEAESSLLFSALLQAHMPLIIEKDILNMEHGQQPPYWHKQIHAVQQENIKSIVQKIRNTKQPKEKAQNRQSLFREFAKQFPANPLNAIIPYLINQRSSSADRLSELFLEYNKLDNKNTVYVYQCDLSSATHNPEIITQISIIPYTRIITQDNNDSETTENSSTIKNGTIVNSCTTLDLCTLTQQQSEGEKEENNTPDEEDPTNHVEQEENVSDNTFVTSVTAITDTEHIEQDTGISAASEKEIQQFIPLESVSDDEYEEQDNTLPPIEEDEDLQIEENEDLQQENIMPALQSQENNDTESSGNADEEDPATEDDDDDKKETYINDPFKAMEITAPLMGKNKEDIIEIDAQPYLTLEESESKSACPDSPSLQR